MSILKDSMILVKSRREVLIIWSWGTLIACMVYGKGFPPLLPTLTAVLSTAFVTISAYIYNDYVDREMDELNPVKKFRPIVSGAVSHEFTRKFIIITGLIGLGLALSLSVLTLLCSLTYYGLFTIYSMPGIRLKKMFLIKEIVIGLGFPLCGLIGSVALSNTIYLPSMFVGVVFGIFLFLIEPGINGVFDVNEDEIYGVKTLARALSWRNQVQMLGLAVLFLMTITPLTYMRFGFSTILPIAVVALGLVTLSNIFPLFESYEMTKVLKFKKILKIYFFTIQLLIIISSMNLGFLPFF